ncbi:2736_t:CDS:2 [Diversispora eburnea]|uniref:2736_t:CDS:1 n=1 Tax=Diversispora eburnea TaxID=1213867 RepID=A0A9N8ZRB7_9GLOM|nr:2736_t:CDS:2 [Diversispora eburnea]
MPKGKKQSRNPMAGGIPTPPPQSPFMMDLDDEDPPDMMPALPAYTKITSDDGAYKTWVCLYPVYFDSTKSVQNGRKIVKDNAVQNPLAKDIAESVKMLGICCVFEPHKTHPKDWANPGRVRVQLFTEFSKPFIKEIPTIAKILSGIQAENPQKFPPSHSPAASSGILKETKSSDTNVGGGSSSSTSSSGRRGRK